MFLLIISTSLFKFRHLIKMRNFSSSPIFVSKVSNLLFEALSFQILLSVALNTFRTSHINHEDLMYRGHNKTFTFSLSRLNFNYLSNILNKGSFFSSRRKQTMNHFLACPTNHQLHLNQNSASYETKARTINPFTPSDMKDFQQLSNIHD